jgi:hypothetical protein
LRIIFARHYRHVTHAAAGVGHRTTPARCVVFNGGHWRLVKEFVEVESGKSSRLSPPSKSSPVHPQRTRSTVPKTRQFRHNVPWLSSVSRCLGPTHVVTPFHHLSGDSHINCSLKAAPITASSQMFSRPRSTTGETRHLIATCGWRAGPVAMAALSRHYQLAQTGRLSARRDRNRGSASTLRLAAKETPKLGLGVESLLLLFHRLL